MAHLPVQFMAKSGEMRVKENGPSVSPWLTREFILRKSSGNNYRVTIFNLDSIESSLSGHSSIWWCR